MVRFSDLAWLYDAENVVLHFDVFSRSHGEIPFNKSFPHKYHYKEKDELTFGAQIVKMDGDKGLSMMPLDSMENYALPKWLMGAQVIKAHPVKGESYSDWINNDQGDGEASYVNITLLIK